MRGERRHNEVAAILVTGSSPRAQGTHIRQNDDDDDILVHPRVRGEPLLNMID